MFTGLVEKVGQIKGIQAKKGGRVLRIYPSLNGKQTSDFTPQVSESIAINGVCLTVTRLINKEFEVYASPNTLSASNLNSLRTGQFVNLERALRLSDRIGGHLVQGHIDGVGKVVEKRMQGETVILTIRIAPEFLKYIVKNGSIAIDGVSLTIKEITNSSFKVTLIPFTLENTTLKDLRAGSLVNIETDILGKYLTK